MSYSIELKNEAITELNKLSQVIQRRIIAKITWLSENFAQIPLQSLTGNLAGFYKLRIGDYRIIYTYNGESKIITIHQIGHRREIYD